MEGDLHQLELKPGMIGRFYGVNCRHEAPPNETDYCRVSLDFRVAPSACYDADWGLLQPGKLKIDHGYLEFTILELSNHNGPACVGGDSLIAHDHSS